jgi:hypothetical protein
MLFLEERDVIITSDVWRVAIDLDTQVYEDTIATVGNDLTSVDKQRKEFTPVAELKQVGNLLNTLELRLSNFQQLVTRLDRCRGLLNLGRTILKTLFGTATFSDLNQLQGTIDELKYKEADIIHSLANQLIYVKGLGQNTRINTDAISNMSSIVKSELVQSHDRYVELTRDVMCLNLTLFNQSALFTVIRELEYALLQLTHQVNELLMAVQYTLSGKLPMTITGPNVLHSILRNISLCLPENYELIAGTKFDNIHLYYELIKVTAVGTAHSNMSILEVPLKTESQRFTLFRIIALPTQVLNDTFALYQLEYDYFGISHREITS